MERMTNSDKIEILADSHERTRQILASYALYDASQDVYQVTEHPEDDRWTVVIVESNPNIIPSNN